MSKNFGGGGDCIFSDTVNKVLEGEVNAKSTLLILYFTSAMAGKVVHSSASRTCSSTVFICLQTD